ncbi:hypothetical protein Q0M94_11825 [Deinococcus radiomollis]|uniref:hypothetical protein n=1 Tax=Deinococcus radiomollis TaxID=468916 RepID=UPI0038915E2B
MNSKLLLTLTALLGNTAATDNATTTALSAWVSEYEPLILTEAQVLLRSPFTWSELGKLAETTVQAVNGLKGVLVGADRAKVAQTVLVVAVKEGLQFLPLPMRAVAGWVLPLLEGPVVAGFIQAAFEKLFPVTAPVTNAPELPSGEAVK